MWNPFKRIRCQCTFCGHSWHIPLIWECHDCHEGVVILR